MVVVVELWETSLEVDTGLKNQDKKNNNVVSHFCIFQAAICS